MTIREILNKFPLPWKPYFSASEGMHVRSEAAFQNGAVPVHYLICVLATSGFLEMAAKQEEQKAAEATTNG